jgi:antitoxin ParD1/3/4
MPMAAKISISLTEDQDNYARSLVDSGQYSSLSAVFQRGLELLRRDDEMHGAKIEALRSLLDQRRAGEFVDLDNGEVADTIVATRIDSLRAKQKS